MDEIKRRLKKKVEGRCTQHGYIKIDSVEFVNVAAGTLQPQTFMGNAMYHIKFRAEVCNPPVGTFIKTRVENINNFGLLCYCNYKNKKGQVIPAIEIIVPKNTVSMVSEVSLDGIKKGDDIVIEIMGTRYELDDQKISAVGRVVKGGASKRLTGPGRTRETGALLDDGPPEADADDYFSDVIADSDEEEERDTDVESGNESGSDAEPDDDPDQEAKSEEEVEDVETEDEIDDDLDEGGDDDDIEGGDYGGFDEDD